MNVFSVFELTANMLGIQQVSTFYSAASLAWWACNLTAIHDDSQGLVQKSFQAMIKEMLVSEY